MSRKNLEKRIRDTSSEADRDQLIQLLRDSGHRIELVTELAKSRDPAVRLWVADTAADLLGADSVPTLRDLARDADVDVRIDALNALVAVDVSEARRMSSTLRKRAMSDDFYEAQSAIWALGAIRDEEALDVIRQVAQNPDAIPGHAAKVVELLMTDPEELCRRIEAHDHDLMPWLAKAGALLGTEAAHRALERCAAEAPDEECRESASQALLRFKPRDPESAL